jgi:TetR/AcrR family transcriptional repressor of lmrAB and yxaGH operons
MVTTARDRLVSTMGRLMQAQGYAATGLNQVVADSGAPKGSLYHYFPQGKEQLAAEAIQAAGEQAAAAFGQAFAAEPDPVAALRAVVEWLRHELVRSDFRYGCPIATVALEVSSRSARLRDACRSAYRAWQVTISAGLRAQGRGPERADPDAVLVLSAIEGALLLSRTERSVEPLAVLSRRLPDLLGDG